MLLLLLLLMVVIPSGRTADNLTRSVQGGLRSSTDLFSETCFRGCLTMEGSPAVLLMSL